MSYEGFLKELLEEIRPFMNFLIAPFVFAIINCVLRIAMNICKGDRIIEKENECEKEKEERKEEDNTDDDLKKYFNYKEEK